MESNHFTIIMSEHSDIKLIDVLKNRKDYEQEAVQAAVLEAIKRNIIIDKNDLDLKYPIIIETENKLDIEFGHESKKADFRKNSIYLYLIGAACGFSIIFSFGSIPYIPIIYLVSVFICSIKYSNIFANILIWVSAFQILAIIGFLFKIIVHIFNS